MMCTVAFAVGMSAHHRGRSTTTINRQRITISGERQRATNAVDRADLSQISTGKLLTGDHMQRQVVRQRTGRIGQQPFQIGGRNRGKRRVGRSEDGERTFTVQRVHQTSRVDRSDQG